MEGGGGLRQALTGSVVAQLLEVECRLERRRIPEVTGRALEAVGCALEGWQIWMLSLAASWMKRSIRALECSGPWPS